MISGSQEPYNYIQVKFSTGTICRERGIWGETPHHIKGGDLSYIYSQYGWSYKETILVNHNTRKAYQLYMESYNQLYIS
jgi:hypothetical protein